MKILRFLAAMLAVQVHADDLRRVALDGATPVAAPVQEDGKDGIARIHKIDQAALEVFPATGQKSRGTILIFPGGGYGILAVTHEGRDVAKMLNQAGWDAAVLLYHVSEGAKTREMALQDAQAAPLAVRKSSAALGLNAERIGIMGFSAGGHLAARLAHENAGAPPACLILMYPAYLDKDGQVLEEVAPVKTPVFEYVAADDKISSGAIAYEKACKAADVPCELHLPEHGGHGFGLKAGLPEGVRDWPEKLQTFLKSLP